ncbi:uncharacterized protein LOC132200096 [Neocloeon triangulifer]|uniref:uncharacterized protein LOC132200096 n=1 Tax=Neocloeon triangulifer TaxID=2078957 RepID=UPI00286FA36C|nr:uncharacterized protein LOC132200096 [Neocloeon triangulifer]
MNINQSDIYIRLGDLMVPTELDKAPRLVNVSYDIQHPYWLDTLELPEVSAQYDELHSNYDLWRRFSDVASDEEHEELDLPLGTNKRRKLHKYRQVLKEKSKRSLRAVPKHIRDYSNRKRLSEFEREEEHRKRFKQMHRVPTVPTFGESNELVYDSDDSTKIVNATQQTDSAESEMEISDHSDADNEVSNDEDDEGIDDEEDDDGAE